MRLRMAKCPFRISFDLRPPIRLIESECLGLGRASLEEEVHHSVLFRVTFDLIHQCETDAVAAQIGTYPQPFHFGEAEGGITD